MRILKNVTYVGGLGADRWIGNGFKDAFEELGHDFFWLTSAEDVGERLREVKPDILMISQDRVTDKNLPAFLEARKNGTKIVLRVDSFFDQDPESARNMTKYDPADLYTGEVEDPQMDRFTEVTGKKYVLIANAAHHKHHFPGKRVKRYECDIAFLGAMMPNKREIFGKLLFPLMKKYNVKLFGPNWTFKDNSLRLAALGARKAGLLKLNEWIGKKRMSVPVDEERDLYASAKISINIHERGEHIKTHVILNERTFKIPACGGFEICDFVPPLRNYFTAEEMVMADDAKGDWVADWFNKIEYYLRREEERRRVQSAGTARALRDHTYVNRVRQMFSLLGLS